MLTCKVGNSIINCFDGSYDKYKLKDWSDRRLLICPDCGSPYEYCHGDVALPYFRHKDKSKLCDEIYHESETEEHMEGKTMLYKWLLSIKDECGLENIKLESYIQETKQKPDIYFEKNGDRYVIEFQCTPIATEYLKRRELYKLAGVKDIWILGTEKYYTGRLKTIEKHSNYHLDTKLKTINIVKEEIKKLIKVSFNEWDVPNKILLDELIFDNKIKFNDDFIKRVHDKYLSYCNKIIQDKKDKEEASKKIKNIKESYRKYLEDYFLKDNDFYSFTRESDFHGLCDIDFKAFNNKPYCIRIYQDSVQIGKETSYTTPFKGKKGGIGWRRVYCFNVMYEKTIDYFDVDNVKRFLVESILDLKKQRDVFLKEEKLENEGRRLKIKNRGVK